MCMYIALNEKDVGLCMVYVCGLGMFPEGQTFTEGEGL